MELNPIQAAITAIEESAARQTANLLKIQDDYLLALQLVALLKLHSQPEGTLDELEVALVDMYSNTALNIYGGNTSPGAINEALQAAGIAVERITQGYRANIRRWHLAGYEQTVLYMPAALVPLTLIQQPKAA